MKLREHFGLQRVVLVGDRGLLTQVQIDHLKRHPGLGWVSALRAVQVRSLVEAEALQLSLFDEQHLAEFASPDYPGERLVACYNPLLAEDRARKRETLLTATEAGLERIAREAARRTRTPLDAAQLGHKVGRVIARHKMAKHFRWAVHDGRLVYERDYARIDAEARLDGIYVLAVSPPRGSPPKTRCAPTRDWPTSSAGSAPSKGLTSGCAPSATARNAGSARICSSACSPATWNGTCAAPGRRCCSTTRPWPAHPRPRRPGQAHRARPAQESIPTHRRRMAPSQPRYPARRTRDSLPQHLSGPRRPLGPGPVCAHRADTDSASRRTPHRNVPSTGNSRKLKN